MPVWWFWALVGFLGVQRVLEMVHARRNTRRLLARGARLVEADGWRLIVAVHVLFFATLMLEAVFAPWAGLGWWTLPALALFGVGQALRYWAITSLGKRWTTRVVVLPRAPLVDEGPYRYLKHPNYVGVALELLALPLAFGLVGTAVAATILNALVLAYRIRVEDVSLGRGAAAHRAQGGG